jgi:large subunit ribosomal protein L3
VLSGDAKKPPRPIDVGIVNKVAAPVGVGHWRNAMSMSEQLGLLGRKVGMMRIFTDDGDTIPVTVLDVSNNRVTQVKTAATDGYNALQIAFGTRKASRVNKPSAGHLAKAGVESGELLKEFRVSADVAGQYAPGAVLPVSVFAAGQKVDVQGTSIGKGFAGTIKRHNFSSQRASHGNSRSHNVPGSISMAQDPGRVFPGKKMTGHMGDETVSVQNLDIVRVDEARSLLLVRGAVPGCKNGHVVVRPAIKAKLKKGAQ